MESMKDYERELEASFRTIQEGDMIEGTVIAVSEEDVILDLQYFTQGIIKAENFSEDPDFKILEEVQVGDVLTATVIRLDDGEGNIELSRKEANDVLVWDTLKQMMDEEVVSTVRIKQSVPSGVVAYLEGVRAFIPASQITSEYVEDTESWVGKDIEVKIITVDPSHKKLVLSGKALAKEKNVEKQLKKVSNLVVGAIFEGTVETLKPFGAFVNIGDGITGLVHISEMSERRLTSPKEVVKLGQKVKVKLLSTDNGKVSLSMKEVEAEEAEARLADELEKYAPKESASTSLGSLLAGLKLD